MFLNLCKGQPADFPVEKVLVRVIDLVEKGVGGALRPGQTRRMERAASEARAEERLILEKIEQEISDVRSGKARFDATGEVITNEVVRPLLLEGTVNAVEIDGADDTTGKMNFSTAALEASQTQEMQRAINLKRVALHAEEVAEEIDGEDKSHTADKTVDPDWFAKWRVSAQEISREEMQRLWAKLLAGEVAKPGTYSLRAMEFLARMSVSDAELLAKLGPFNTDGGIIRPTESDLLNSKGISFGDLLELDGMGVLKGAVGLGGLSLPLKTSIQMDRNIAILRCNGAASIFDLGDASTEQKPLELETIALTQIAREILSLVKFSPDQDYLRAIAEYSLTKGTKKLSLGQLHPNGREIVGVHEIATE